MAKQSKATKATLLPVERIESRIVLLREQKVMLDVDLGVARRMTGKRFPQCGQLPK